MTPPQMPASTDATPSVSRIVRVSYSSPAAAALSVQSMPPTIVARAKGKATGKYASDAHHTRSHQARSQTKAGNGELSAVEEMAPPASGGGTRGQPYF